MLLLTPQISIYESLRVRLPPPAETLVPLVRWFARYWWAVLLGLALLAPVLVLVTWSARHCVRSCVWGWAWGTLLLTLPLLLLEGVAYSSFAFGVSAAREVQARDREILEYLSPDEQSLRWPLKLREVRRGPAGPTGDVVVVEPGGEWRVLPGVGGEGPPLREGKLGMHQLTVLANQLAGQRFFEVAEPDGLPGALDGDSLDVEFGPYHLRWPGLTRAALWRGGPAAELEEWRVRGKFAALVLTIDDMVKQGNP
jgi:hypothetical protein